MALNIFINNLIILESVNSTKTVVTETHSVSMKQDLRQDTKLKKIDAYSILSNCMVYDKKMTHREFETQCLNMSNENGDLFFPLSNQPEYLSSRNFDEKATLNYIHLTVFLFNPQYKKTSLFQYENCEIGVNKNNNSNKIGVIITKKMKKELIAAINNVAESIIVINIKADKDTEEFTIIKIYSGANYVRVSTIPILEYRSSEPLLKNSHIYANHSEKYQFLHYLYVLSQIGEKERITTVHNTSKRGITITSFLLDCHTPANCIKSQKHNIAVFKKNIDSVFTKPSQACIMQITSNHSNLKKISSTSIIHFCYNPNELADKVYKIRFYESFFGMTMKTHTVLFDIKKNKVEHSYCLGESNLLIQSDFKGGYNIMISVDINTHFKNIKPEAFKELKVDLFSSGFEYKTVSFQPHIVKIDIDRFFVSIEIPLLFKESHNSTHRELHKILDEKDGIFFLAIFYEEENDFKQTLKMDEYVICLDFNKLFFRKMKLNHE
ncbi:hypothetical protein CDIK_2649 [Cucumispora dikerogammari]|nr:hypothetical protein CDIK_2649 [Cucumispora dikerogammari]